MHRGLALAWLCCGGCPAEYEIVPPLPDEWRSPNPPDPASPVHTDRILQVVEPVVDVLWILDNSPTMVNDRDALARAFPNFIQPFVDSAVDWHVGVITTDMETDGHGGQLQERDAIRWLDPDVPDFEQVFVQMATANLEGGSIKERGREAAWTALDHHRDGFNKGFLRDASSGWLHLTVVSDEDDDTDEQQLTVQAFADFLVWLRPFPGRVSFNSIVSLDGHGTEERGEDYIALSELLGGLVADVSASNWDGLMDDLGGLQAPEAIDEFFLSVLPVPETLDVHGVTASGVTLVYVQGTDYTYVEERNSIAFVDAPPPIGSSLEITYTVSAARVQ